MLTVLLLALLVFPVIYSLVLQFQEKRKRQDFEANQLKG
jgi:Cu(I)/Ag(I) efflux system membrane protein CusA/SilA